MQLLLLQFNFASLLHSIMSFIFLRFHERHLQAFWLIYILQRLLLPRFWQGQFNSKLVFAFPSRKLDDFMLLQHSKSCPGADCLIPLLFNIHLLLL